MGGSSGQGMSTGGRLLTGAATVLASLLPGALAHAQTAFDRSTNIGVLERPHPEYDALGIRLRQFMIYPKIELNASYQDNVYAAENDAVDDTALGVRPSISAESTWSRHSLVVSAGANVQRYSDLDQEDSSQYRVDAVGRLDIRRDANVGVTAGFAHSIEQRGTSAYLTATQSPIEYDSASVRLSGLKDFNRVRLSGAIGSSSLNYENGSTFAGAVVNQDFRDSDTLVASGRIDHALSPATALFGEISGTEVAYDQVVFQNRDSQGTRYLAGVNFELTNLMTGEISAGYITRSFDDNVTDDINQFSYRASVNWYPTELVTVGLTADKVINDSGLQGTPAYVADTVGVRVDYELMRNLIVTAVGDYSRNNYRNISREDQRYGAGLTATYLVNRWAGVSLTYNQVTQDSSGSERGVQYTERTFGVALVLQR